MSYPIGIINLADLRWIEIAPGRRDRGTNEGVGRRLVGGGGWPVYTYSVVIIQQYGSKSPPQKHKYSTLIFYATKILPLNNLFLL